MDGENSGKSYEKMDDLGGKNPIFGNTQMGWVITPNKGEIHAGKPFIFGHL